MASSKISAPLMYIYAAFFKKKNLVSIWSESGLLCSFPYFRLSFRLNSLSQNASTVRMCGNIWFLYTNQPLYCLLQHIWRSEQNYQTKWFVFVFSGHLDFILSSKTTFLYNVWLISPHPQKVSRWKSHTQTRYKLCHTSLFTDEVLASL